MNPFSIVLFEPEIPPNTGNIARLCAGTDTKLHLIEPLGFSISDKHLKRAGLDYWPNVKLSVWKNWQDFRDNTEIGRLITTSAKRGAPLFNFEFKPGDHLVFGPETRGLPEWMFEDITHAINIPTNKKIRSLNLSTSAGIILYQALASLNDDTLFE
ncbi:tRNA (cytidine(34)-2'-O)-methyltransferase [Maridesulfovibrio ferrireducens]|uniref:tRNA (cytidine(34)-2'-O)-methyltransferase n=1 Tax=Maridesulfovibrio ferrireducens TaxID=246191 RepID=UPI001A1FBDA2|nr:tRNA (cytidine(34)-2'-O)-methyltransferase [Maridesulfovibrio ferrireducens]MBI9110405.1 tRNA (cytidine(34)-2'-O)-methyltransferase [Maridesulfovibrio ferrireducens]